VASWSDVKEEDGGFRDIRVDSGAGFIKS